MKKCSNQAQGIDALWKRDTNALCPSENVAFLKICKKQEYHVCSMIPRSQKSGRATRKAAAEEKARMQLLQNGTLGCQFLSNVYLLFLLGLEL
jgi:hypothetical protein